jgi:hypothetical protein
MGKANIFKSTITAIAVGACVAAFAVPALAGGGVGSDMGVVASTLGSPDPHDSISGLGLVPSTLGSPDPRDTSQQAAGLGLVPSALGSPDPRDTTIQAPDVAAGGFDWAAFGIGVGASVGLMLLLAALAAVMREGRQAAHGLGSA